MFWRILRQLMGASRGRLAVALLTLISGAAICSALLNINLDAQRKMTREFRTLGANVVVAPPQTEGNAALAEQGVAQRIQALDSPLLVAAAPYLYVAASSGTQPVILAGTWFDQAARMNSWWKVNGTSVTARDDRSHCMVGRTAARLLGLSPGSQIILRSGDHRVSLTVSGVISSGGDADSQVFTSLDVAQQLSGVPGHVSLVQASVSGTSAQIEAFTHRLSGVLPGLRVRPVRQLASAEGLLLERIHGLIFWTIMLILVLTTMGVLASMTALAMERSRDVGLMKALGGPVSRIMRLFLTEAGVLGVIGGTLGFFVGAILARWIGTQVFGVAISPRPVVFPVTVLLTAAVALAGAFPLRLLGLVRPAEILRGE